MINQAQIDDIVIQEVRKEHSVYVNDPLLYQGDYVVNGCKKAGSLIYKVALDHAEHHLLQRRTFLPEQCDVISAVIKSLKD